MSVNYERTSAALRAVGIDPGVVVADSLDESGYTMLGRHQDGRVLPADRLTVSRVPWPSREAWLRVQQCLAVDMAAAFGARRRAVIVDVDGTLVDVTSVRHHVLSHPKDFDAFHRGAEDCPPIPTTLAVIRAWRAVADIVVVTARMRMWEASTRRWLDRHLPGRYELHMRANGDYRPDFQVKREILTTIRQTHDVAFAIDDNPSVVALWEAEGIPTLTIPGWAEEEARD